ncbi:MAG: tetratricopeptide repeat protein [Candidatus Heimdallarchaeota archaeon]|nr:tetratricopeptide repeat protein [Candidatus Heimdallarchaeota archaeon]
MALRALFNFFKRKKEADALSHSEELLKAEQLMLQGKLKESLEEVDKLQEKKGLTKENQIACKILKGGIFIKLGDQKMGLSLAEEAFEESQKIKAIELCVDALITKADALFRLGQLDEAIKSLEMSEDLLKKLTTLEQLERTEREAHMTHRKGTIYWNQGKLNLALKNLKRSLFIRKELGNQRNIAASLNNIGLVYLQKGELDRAMESFQESLTIAKELALPHYVAAILGNIGTIHQAKGEFDKAFDCYDRVIALFKEIGNDSYISEALYRMISLKIEEDQLDKAEHYLEELEVINQEGDHKIIDQRFRLSKAMLLKTSDRTIHKAEAQKLFQEIAEEEVIDHELTVLAMLNLCELLLIELKNFGNESVLEEIEELANKLLEIASQQNSFSLLAETYLLESKLALIKLDLRKAQQLLTQAQMIAEEKGLKKLAVNLSNEHDSLLMQQKKWKELAERRASLTERLEMVKLEDMLGRMMLKKIEDVKEVPEEAVLLVILAESGLTLFSLQFESEQKINEQLVGGFLTAINTFCRETFSSAGSLERIKHQEYTVLMKAIGGLMFCYVFKGQSYSALQKLEEFIHLLETEKNLLEELTQSASEGQIALVKSRKLEEIAENVFQ